MFTPFHRFPGFSEAAQPGFSPSQIFQFLFSQPFISIIQKTLKCFREPNLLAPFARVILPWRWSWTLMAGRMILSLQNPFFHPKWLDYAKLDLKNSLNLFRMSNNFVVCPKGDLNFLFKNSTFCSFCLFLFIPSSALDLKTGTLVWAHLYHFKPTKL